jgi:hypothetical protein
MAAYADISAGVPLSNALETIGMTHAQATGFAASWSFVDQYTDASGASTAQDNTISLGGGIRNADLALRKSSNDLILDTGNGESITLQNWYAATANKSVLTLQMIEEAAADFTAGGTDPLRDNKVEQFNFAGLVDAFDQARTADPTLTSWALSNALLAFHLGGSDAAAIGGIWLTSTARLEVLRASASVPPRRIWRTASSDKSAKPSTSRACRTGW